MSFQATIKFSHEGTEYLAIQSSYTENADDMVISSIYSLVALLEFGNPKVDNDIIDHLKISIEGLRNK